VRALQWGDRKRQRLADGRTPSVGRHKNSCFSAVFHFFDGKYDLSSQVSSPCSTLLSSNLHNSRLTQLVGGRETYGSFFKFFEEVVLEIFLNAELVPVKERTVIHFCLSIGSAGHQLSILALFHVYSVVEVPQEYYISFVPDHLLEDAVDCLVATFAFVLVSCEMAVYELKLLPKD
jgi:hypothetical protein